VLYIWGQHAGGVPYVSRRFPNTPADGERLGRGTPTALKFEAAVVDFGVCERTAFALLANRKVVVSLHSSFRVPSSCFAVGVCVGSGPDHRCSSAQRHGP
jgi:hypothetical protein